MITIPLNDFSFIEQHNQSANHHIYIYIYNSRKWSKFLFANVDTSYILRVSLIKNS